MALNIDATYPTIARWVMEFGWIQIGQDEMSRSFIRALSAYFIFYKDTTQRTAATFCHRGVGACLLYGRL